MVPAITKKAAFVLAAVVLFAGGLLLGYKGTTAGQVHPASPVNVPPPVINMPTSSVEQNWSVYFLGRPMTNYQQYTCDKFGATCRIALAIQAAENLKGDCEAYHYNSDGTLDWGYFQINSVHLTRRGVNLRDLLDCKANIDFAYRLYSEEGFQPWSTFVGGQYRKFLDDSLPHAKPRSPLLRSPGGLIVPTGLSSQ